jgi:GR25 family glycosyltransferase involved in LPS biosynthesis
MDRKKNVEGELSKLKFDPNKIYKLDAIYDIINGHRGCAKSHIKALEYAIKHDYNNIIIVEDDITINHIFKNELQSFFELKLEKWDVLLLGGSYINSKPYKNNIHKLVSATTTKGYVVSKHYYKTLLNCFMEAYNKINEEMDDKLNFTNHTKYAIDQHWHRLSKKDNWFIINPNVITQKNSKSDIMNKKNIKYTVSRSGLLYPFYHVMEGNTKFKDILVLNGPIRANQNKKDFFDLKAKGYYFVGMSSYMSFPEKVLNPHDNDISKNFDMWEDIKYYENVIGWCYCQRNPKIPEHIPRILLTESDMSNEKNLMNITKNINKNKPKKYDFIYSCLAGKWNNYNRNWELAKKCIDIMVNQYNLKVLLVGRKDEPDCPKHKNIEVTNMLPYVEFIKTMTQAKYLFVPNINDASPRVASEALILGLPILENRNIVGGWHYVNKDTGMDFNDLEEFKIVLPQFLKGIYRPNEWYAEHYHNDISCKRLAWFINKLERPIFMDGDVYNLFDKVIYFDENDKIGKNGEMENGKILYINREIKFGDEFNFNDKIVHYINLFMEHFRLWDIMVLQGLSTKEIDNDFVYCNNLISAKNINIFITNFNVDKKEKLINNILDITNTDQSYILDQNLWTMLNINNNFDNFESGITINKTMEINKKNTFELNNQTIYYENGYFEIDKNKKKMIEYKNKIKFAEFDILDNGIFKDTSRGYLVKFENNKCYFTKYLNLNLNDLNNLVCKWNFLFNTTYYKCKWIYDDDTNQNYFIENTNNKWTEYKKNNIFSTFELISKNSTKLELLLYDEKRKLYIKLEPTKSYHSKDKIKWHHLHKGFII